MALSFELDDAEKKYLLRQAKLSIQSALDGNKAAKPLNPTPVTISECAVNLEESAVNQELGSFVTLTENGALRGCIGTIIGREPLYLNVWNMARAAAFHDARFRPLTSAEWPQVKVDISVLDKPALCPDPEQIVIGRDGLILDYQGRSGVFLPQVPVEQGWNLQEYLDHLCVKAGVAPGSWSKPGAKIYWYQAMVFGDGHN